MRRYAVLAVCLVAALALIVFRPGSPATTSATMTVAQTFPPQPQSSPAIGACPVFPLNNVWNTPIDTLPVHALSDQYIASIGAGTGLHPDFGSGTWDGGPIGIPFNIVPAAQPPVTVNFVEYGDESDDNAEHLLYPVPPAALREHGSDHHVLIVREGECKLYELYHAEKISDSVWEAGSGAIYDLRSNALRPDGWTSADAAGLPILPGLVRYEEVAAGEIKHAIRFTIEATQAAYVWPARHKASDTADLNVPPMGQRFRLKASFDVTPFAPEVQVILRAMQKYGLIVADNGSDWYISGAPDERWDNDTLVDQFRDITGDQFEAVDVSSLQLDPDTAEVVAGAAPQPAKLASRGGVLQNDLLTYAIRIVGSGGAMSVSDPLPAGLSYVPASAAIAPASLPAPTFAGGAVQWSGSLPNSQTAVITFQATVTAAQRQTITNVATISGGPAPQDVAASVVANGASQRLPLLRR